MLQEKFLTFKKTLYTHKITSILVACVILFGCYKIYYAVYPTTGQTTYSLGTVQKGLIISTVSASGQVSTTNQLDVKAKVSGDITSVQIKVGDKVYAGQVLATIDNTTAKQNVLDAEASLQASKLQFQKDQTQAPIDYQKAQDALVTAQTDLNTEYDNVFTSISNAYLDLPAIVTGMENILYGYDLSPNKAQGNADVLINIFNNDTRIKVQGYATSAENDYTIARTSYDASILSYKNITRNSDNATLETILDQSIKSTTNIAQSLQSESNFLSTVVDTANQYDIHVPTTVTTLQTNIKSYLSTVNNDLNSLLSEKKSLLVAKQTVTTDTQNITLLQVGNATGNNPISLQISQNSIAKQEEDLLNLKKTLSYYTVVAPFSGTVSAVNAKVADTAGTIATIVTNQQVAQLSLNEVDAAKITYGEKAILTFDAIDGLSLTGTVNEIDPVGTVSQGVVSYTVKIVFDTQDARIKPGMTVNASIQTAVHPDVLLVPSSAIKTTMGKKYVQVFNPPLDTSAGTTGILSVITPQQVEITTGISDDTNTEILTGLTEGEQIITRVTTSSATKTTATPSATSLLGGGNTRGGVRIGG